MQLYDLMTMGFKYQCLCSTSPADILQVTLNHIDSLMQLAKSVEGQAVEALVKRARDLTLEVSAAQMQVIQCKCIASLCCSIFISSFYFCEVQEVE